MDRLCEKIGVPADAASSFKKSIPHHIGAYRESKKEKCAKAIDRELQTISKVVETTLKFAYGKTPRPKDFAEAVKDVSRRLGKISPDAREYLAWRGQKIVVSCSDPPPEPRFSPDLINPLCYQSREQQIEALLSLCGSLSGRHARPRGRGRPPKTPEQILYLMLGFAYERATGKKAHDRSRQFIDLCDALKDRYDLAEFRPEGLARASRKRRKTGVD